MLQEANSAVGGGDCSLIKCEFLGFFHGFVSSRVGKLRDVQRSRGCGSLSGSTRSSSSF